MADISSRERELTSALRECVAAMEQTWTNHGNSGKPWPLREYTIAMKALGHDEGWPEPAPLPPDYWETAE